MSPTDVVPLVATLDVTCYTFSDAPIALVGSTPQTGEWDVSRGLPLRYAGSTIGRHAWQGTVEMDPGETVAFKFVEMGTGAPQWELGENRTCVAAASSQYLQSYFRNGNETWHRLRAGDVQPGGGSLTARGDIVRALELLVFLSDSAAHEIQAATLATISPAAARMLHDAAERDGYEAGQSVTFIKRLAMASGRLSREVILAHLPTSEFDQSSIDYVIEEGVLVGALVRNRIW